MLCPSFLLLLSARPGQVANSSIPVSARPAAAMFSRRRGALRRMIKPGPDMVAPGATIPTPAGTPTATFAASARPMSAAPAAAPSTATSWSSRPQATRPRWTPQSPRADEKASAGLYSVTLARYRHRRRNHRCPPLRHLSISLSPGAQANLLFDVSHCLALRNEEHGESQSSSPRRFKVLSPTEVAGSTSVTGGWNKQPNTYTVYFYAQTDTPAASWGTWLDGQLSPAAKAVSGPAQTKVRRMADICRRSRPSGADEDRHLLHQHRAGAPQSRRRDSRLRFRRDSRRRTWPSGNSALGKVEIKGETPEQAQIFYTALYHTMLMPTDRTGENPLWKSASLTTTTTTPSGISSAPPARCSR